MNGGRGPRREPGPCDRLRDQRLGQAGHRRRLRQADLLVASNRSGAFGLYQLRPESPDTLLPVLVDGGGNVQGVRSPDRTRIAFSSMRAGSYDLYVMDADGRESRAASPPIRGSEGEPVWTPDGVAHSSTPPRRRPACPS